MPPADPKITTPVQVTPEDFHTVATEVSSAVTQLCDIAKKLHASTTAAAGIGGVDDGAKQFDSGYMKALNTLLQTFDRASDVLTDVSLGIDLSGYNHWKADAAAAPAGDTSPPWNLVSGLYLPQSLQATSLIGKPVMTLPAPLDAKIPMGHHTVLHDLADQFTGAANSINDLRNHVFNEMLELFANNSSADLDALNDYWNTIGGSSDTAILTALEQGCQQLSQAISDFADWVTDTQTQIIDQIISFTGKIAKDTALSLIPALLASLVTDGLGGLPELIQVIQKVGEFGELVAVVEAVDVIAAGRLTSGILAIATTADTAMTAAMSTTPNPNVNSTTPASTSSAPSDEVETEDAQSISSRVNTSEPEHYHDLGWDPAVGSFRENEAQTATEIENTRGIRLTRNPNAKGPDWTGSDGKSYDALGPMPSQFFDRQWSNLQYRITQHLGKADMVPIDVNGLTEQQANTVRQYLSDNATSLNGRVFIVGEE